MPCSDCGYLLKAGQTDCPRCGYRKHRSRAEVRSVATSPDPAEPDAAPASAHEMASPRRTKISLSLAAFLVGAAVLLAHFGLLAYHHARAIAAEEGQAGAIFASADGPCRDGVEATCRKAIGALHAVRDHSDASLLLGDLRVAQYLKGLPQGGPLQERWSRDQLSAGELTALGNEACRRHLIVFRSFWMYANVKQNHFPVPTLTINDDHINILK